ncbi:MAG: hypothetical protein DCC46_01200 [Armatimonadetes bacterium]|nr:MAG: hypothetical protein DCC46_01200 [Armatimonadota bacterium]
MAEGALGTSWMIRALQDQYSGTKGRDVFGDDDLQRYFGIKGYASDPFVTVIASMSSSAGASDIRRVGAVELGRIGRFVFLRCRVSALGVLTRVPGVQRVDVAQAGVVRPPQRARTSQSLLGPGGTGRKGPESDSVGQFRSATYTGRGVVIGVIDTGIDWQHQDFIKPDGTSRILLLWDQEDDSWEKARTGSAPPYVDEDGQPIGTVYTKAQIDAALKGTGKVASSDKIGHGTAVAGVAAGNGRATANGVPAGTFAGIAPEADLIVVKGLHFPFGLAAKWVFERAKAQGKPCVVNMSFGTHFSPHDGSRPEERSLDELVGEGIPGTAICVSAGNERGDNSHAGGRFGPRAPGQLDVDAPYKVLDVAAGSTVALVAVFDKADEWGFAITGEQEPFKDSAGYATLYQVDKGGGTIGAYKYEVKDKRFTKLEEPENSSRFYFDQEGNSDIVLTMKLTGGRYYLWGYGATEKVVNGRFDLYLLSSEGGFSTGAEQRYLVSSPGTASAVITVGAFDFTRAWTNLNGKVSRYNLLLGNISDYSSPGYRRDGQVKPDIAAPGTYAISSLAKGCEMGLDVDGSPNARMITSDGLHLAWSGTSAASPYVAGVVALMLQKNPNLNATQIKKILAESAKSDDFTGRTPNPDWGFGKIDPERALKATPEVTQALAWYDASMFAKDRRSQNAGERSFNRKVILSDVRQAVGRL